MKTINRVPIVQQVADNIREMVVSGQANEGQKLPSEKELCEGMGVGRGTVREALRILQAKGFVEIKPGRGAFVASKKGTTLDTLIQWFEENEVELRDCIEIRTAIEPLAVRLMIQRCSDEDIEQLTAVHVKFLKAVEEDNVVGIAKYDERFHDMIVEKSQNKLLGSINRKVSMCIKAFRSKTFLVEENVKNAVGPHTNILGAIKDRDVEAADLFVRRHLEQVAIDLKRFSSVD